MKWSFKSTKQWCSARVTCSVTISNALIHPQASLTILIRNILSTNKRRFLIIWRLYWTKTGSQCRLRKDVRATIKIANVYQRNDGGTREQLASIGSFSQHPRRTAACYFEGPNSALVPVRKKNWNLTWRLSRPRTARYRIVLRFRTVPMLTQCITGITRCAYWNATHVSRCRSADGICAFVHVAACCRRLPPLLQPAAAAAHFVNSKTPSRRSRQIDARQRTRVHSFRTVSCKCTGWYDIRPYVDAD